MINETKPLILMYEQGIIRPRALLEEWACELLFVNEVVVPTYKLSINALRIIINFLQDLLSKILSRYIKE